MAVIGILLAAALVMGVGGALVMGGLGLAASHPLSSPQPSRPNIHIRVNGEETAVVPGDHEGPISLGPMAPATSSLGETDATTSTEVAQGEPDGEAASEDDGAVVSTATVSEDSRNSEPTVQVFESVYGGPAAASTRESPVDPELPERSDDVDDTAALMPDAKL